MAKRRPAPQITVASAPQVLSPKRFCQTSLVTAGIANHQLVTGAPVQQQVVGAPHKLPTTVFDTQTLLRSQAAAAAAGIIQPITANHHHHAALQQQIAAVIANNNKNSLPFLHQQPPQVQIQHTSSGLVHSVTPILTTTASPTNNNNHTILNNNNNNNNTTTNNITSTQNELNIAVSSHNNSQSTLNHINAQQGSPIDNSESNSNNNNNNQQTNDAPQQQGANINTPTNNNNNNNNMDNPMGQMTPIAPLTLSQSMDSVNTNSNEEEVSKVLL